MTGGAIGMADGADITDCTGVAGGAIGMAYGAIYMTAGIIG
jgi:hypothetical protein